MEVLLSSLLSADVNQKLAGCERMQQKIQESNVDVGIKVMSACVGLLKEANLKILLAALDAVEALVTLRKDQFGPLLNMMLDVLIPRLGDTKINVREKAKDVLTAVVDTYEPALTVERMGSNLCNKNVHIKTALLEMLVRVYPRTISEPASSAGLCAKIAVLLNDQQSTVRQAALDTLVQMKDAFGTTIISTLVELRVKPMYIQHFEGMQLDRPITTTKLSPGASDARASRRLADTVVASVAGPTGGMRARSVSVNLVEAYGSDDATPSAESDLSPTGVASLDSSLAGFSPRSFLDFLHGDSPVLPVRMTDEREFQTFVDRIFTDLGKADDWSKRIQAMVSLQSLAWGTLVDYPETAAVLRRFQDLVSVQLADLRSSVCKETCKTLAVLAYTVPQPFMLLLDFWWPKIVRVLAIKIQVMSASADRCIRSIVASCQDQRFMQLLLECCGNKNAILRKLGLEYLSIACAMWRTDIVEKNLAALKAVLKGGLSDADAQARKIARALYWMLSELSFAKRMTSQLSDELDASTQKHLAAEKRSPELSAILALPRRLLQSMEAELSATAAEPEARLPHGIDGIAAQASAARPNSTMPAAPLPSDMDLLLQDEVLDVELAPKSRALGGGSKRMSLTGPVRVPSVASSATSTSSVLGSTSAGPMSSLSRPASRRISMATALLPPPATSDSAVFAPPPAAITPSANQLPLDAGVDVGPLSSFSSFLDDDQPLAAASTWNNARVTAGKENRRASLAANFSSSALLANGPKRMLAPQPADGTPKPIVEDKGALSVNVPKATAQPESTQVMAVSLSQTLSTAAASQEKPVVFCAQSLLKMSEDSSWSVRLKALEDINKRIERAFVNMESLSQIHMDTFLSVAIKCQDDSQLKVAMEALKIIKLSLEMFAERCEPQLTSLVLNAFQQLNDRRTAIRDAANEMLTLLRGKFTPNIVARAMIQVMMEVPERTKTAVMQYLGALLPLVDTSQAGTIDVLVDLLHKIADMVTATQPKPTITLTAAGKRIVAMLFKISPDLMVAEVAKMKFQQLSMMKIMLKGSAPDIESLLLQASKSMMKTKLAGSAPAAGPAVIAATPAPSSSSVAVVAPTQVETPTLAFSELYPEFEDAAAGGSCATDTLDDIVQAKAREPLLDVASLPVVAALTTRQAPSPHTVSPTVVGRLLTTNQELEFNYRPLLSEQNSGAVSREGVSSVLVSHYEDAQPTRTVVHTNPTTRSTVIAAETSANVMMMRIPGTERTLQYVLQGLGTTATAHHRKEVHGLLKQLAKNGDSSYWEAHGHQLLEGILTAAKVLQRSDVGSEEEEALMSLFLLLLRYRGKSVQPGKLGLLVDVFVTMAVEQQLRGEKLVLYTEIVSHLATLQPAATLKTCLVAWPSISWSFPPTDPDSAAFRVNLQLLLIHAASQSCAVLCLDELDVRVVDVVESLVLPVIASESIELRKAAVFLLVELYLRMDTALLPHVQALSTAQRQLMMIYVEKKRTALA